MKISRLENLYIKKLFTAKKITDAIQWKVVTTDFSQRYLMGKKFFELGMLYKTANDAVGENKPIHDVLKNVAKISEISVKTLEKINSTNIIDVNPLRHENYVLFAHGVGTTITSNYYQKMYAKLANKIGVAAPEYRGYGENLKAVKGMDLRETMTEDIDAGMKYLKNKGIDEKNVIILGYCGGCSQAIAVAKKYKNLKHLILMSPYTSFEYIPAADCFRTYLKYHKYKSPDLENISDVEAPVTIVHVKKDQILPFNAPLELSKRVKKLDKFIILPNDDTHWFNNNKIDVLDSLIDNLITV